MHDTCWSYATMAASETSILREGLYDNPLRSLDFSELKHAYITKNNDPKDNLPTLYWFYRHYYIR